MIKNLIKKINYLSKIYRKWPHGQIIYRDYKKKSEMIRTNQEHLEAAMQWLKKAQDVTKNGGVSAGYWFETGWRTAYPETTGYIIPTFIEYYKLSGQQEYLERALNMADWEIQIQLPSGGIRAGVGLHQEPAVFNTGQVILGWLAAHKATKSDKYIKAAKKAADWLLTVQDSDGKWTRYAYNSVPHTYYSRVAWPLLELSALLGEHKYREGAVKNIKWALSNSRANGWFDYLGFTEDEFPLTHTISYALEGLIESVVFLSKEIVDEIIRIVSKAAENLMLKYEVRKTAGPYSLPKFLPASFDKDWRAQAAYSCLTGNGQTALVWMKLYKLNNDIRFLNSALKVIDQLKSTQNLDSKEPGINGGIAGSYPIWGAYKAYAYPNWPAKFFADAIMLQELLMKKI